VCAILDAWRKANAWIVGRYVIMPDHVHLFCAPVRADVPLGKWIKYWKSLVTRSWQDASEKPIWQLDFFDRQLRHDESYAAKWEYVRENPVRRPSPRFG
jgi:REP element-mobilizing transposase RayT